MLFFYLYLGYSIALQKCKLCKFARRELWTPSILKYRWNNKEVYCFLFLNSCLNLLLHPSKIYIFIQPQSGWLKLIKVVKLLSSSLIIYEDQYQSRLRRVKTCWKNLFGVLGNNYIPILSKQLGWGLLFCHRYSLFRMEKKTGHLTSLFSLLYI